MDRTTARYFLNKDVRIVTNSTWFYKGLVKELTDDGLIIDDIKVGITFVSYSDIKTMENWRRENGS